MTGKCAECGMPVAINESHPYAACLMFKGCHNSKTVKANLDAMTHDKDWRIAELEAEVARLNDLIQLGEKGFVMMPEWIKTAEDFAKWAKGFNNRR